MTLKKPADANHPIHDLIRNRWSPRAFAGTPVARTTLLTVLEAARWAASSNNGQPWAFIVATKEDAAEHQRLVDCLMPGNQGWAINAPVYPLLATRQVWPPACPFVTVLSGFPDLLGARRQALRHVVSPPCPGGLRGVGGPSSTGFEPRPSASRHAGRCQEGHGGRRSDTLCSHRATSWPSAMRRN